MAHKIRAIPGFLSEPKCDGIVYTRARIGGGEVGVFFCSHACGQGIKCVSLFCSRRYPGQENVPGIKSNIVRVVETFLLLLSQTLRV